MFIFPVLPEDLVKTKEIITMKIQHLFMIVTLCLSDLGQHCLHSDNHLQGQRLQKKQTYPVVQWARMTRCCLTSCRVLLKRRLQQWSEDRSFSAAETPGGDKHNQSHAMKFRKLTSNYLLFSLFEDKYISRRMY